MLVLSRKESQRVMLGSDIEVTVLSIQGGRVKLGFSCPPHVSIRREELQQHSPSPDLTVAIADDPFMASAVA